MRFLRCDSQTDADTFSRGLWAFVRPEPDPRDVTTHALLVTQDSGDWGTNMPDDFTLPRWSGFNGRQPDTAALELVMTQGQATALLARGLVTMDHIATAGGARVRTL